MSASGIRRMKRPSPPVCACEFRHQHAQIWLQKTRRPNPDGHLETTHSRLRQTCSGSPELPHPGRQTPIQVCQPFLPESAMLALKFSTPQHFLRIILFGGFLNTGPFAVIR